MHVAVKNASYSEVYQAAMKYNQIANRHIFINGNKKAQKW